MDRRRILGQLGAGCALAALSGGAARAEITQATRVPPARIKTETVAKGLEFPWGLQFLPGSRFLVTERPGRVRVIEADGTVSPPLAGTPPVAATGQGGMLDVALHPDFERSGLVYLSFAEPRDGNRNGTSVGRGRLLLTGGRPRIEGFEVIFRQVPELSGGLHFGGRLAFAGDGRLFITLGERFQKEGAQDLARLWGKVVRIEQDGSIPKDNPFVGRAGARPEIWSYGHRNPQSAAIHPATGKLWIVEHGPQGGDEINIPLAGRNYGWPVIGYGIDYSGARLHQSTHQEGMEQPIYYWRPSIAPSGMAFHSNGGYEGREGSLLVGALAGRALHRLILEGETVVAEEVLLEDLGERIRDVRVSPDGGIYVLTDHSSGRLLRLRPASE